MAVIVFVIFLVIDLVFTWRAIDSSFAMICCIVLLSYHFSPSFTHIARYEATYI